MRLLVRAGCAVAERLGWAPRLEFEAIQAAAGRAIGHPNLEDPDAREALEAILTSVREDFDLNAQGRVALGRRFLDIFQQRAWIRGRAERGELVPLDAVAPPIVITGFPRTGTTFSHRILAAAEDARCPLWCEGMEPALDPRLDPNVARARRLRKYRWLCRMSGVVAPRLRSIHELTADGPEECTQFHELAYDSESLVLVGPCVSYRSWLDGRNEEQLRRRYHWQELALSSIVADRPGSERHGRWVLKAPQHLVQLDQLFERFPDAKVIRMHRDPREAMPSAASLVECGASIMNRRLEAFNGDDLLEMFIEWQQKGDEAMARHRDSVLEVRYDDLVANPMGFVERVHEFAGIPVDASHRAAIAAYLRNRPQHHFGRHAYTLEQYGLDEAQVEQAVGDYTRRMDDIPGF
ncbi:MAG: sulfotransferase [Phycisphaerales bacterium]|nr:sulfotransferase [Phycisphaerales bacterium]